MWVGSRANQCRLHRLRYDVAHTKQMPSKLLKEHTFPGVSRAQQRMSLAWTTRGVPYLLSAVSRIHAASVSRCWPPYRPFGFAQILDQVVIPCNGTRNSQTWSTSKCSTVSEAVAPAPGAAKERRDTGLGFGACRNPKAVTLLTVLGDLLISMRGLRLHQSHHSNTHTPSRTRFAQADMLGWGDAASAVARSRLGDAAFSSYSHLVLLLPSGWKAVADPSCAGVVASADLSVPRSRPGGGPGYGYVWITGRWGCAGAVPVG